MPSTVEVCGQGRLEAYQALGQREIPALIVDADAEGGVVAAAPELRDDEIAVVEREDDRAAGSIPGMLRGKVTRKKVSTRLAPNDSAGRSWTPRRTAFLR